MTSRRWGPGSRAALVCCIAAGGLAVWAGVEAWRIDAPPPPRVPPESEFAMPEVPAPREALPAKVVLSAIGRDPFRPDRRPATQRYRLPGEAPPRTMPSVANWQLLGTASRADGRGIAAIATSGGRDARVYHVGDLVGEFRLVRVAPGTAVLAWQDTTITLTTSGQGREP